MSMINYLVMFVKKLKNYIPERSITGEKWNSLKMITMAGEVTSWGPVSGKHPHSQLFIMRSFNGQTLGKAPKHCT